MSSYMFTRNKIVLSVNDSPRKPLALGRRPKDSTANAIARSLQVASATTTTMLSSVGSRVEVAGVASVTDCRWAGGSVYAYRSSIIVGCYCCSTRFVFSTFAFGSEQNSEDSETDKTRKPSIPTKFGKVPWLREVALSSHNQVFAI